MKIVTSMENNQAINDIKNNILYEQTLKKEEEETKIDNNLYKINEKEKEVISKNSKEENKINIKEENGETNRRIIKKVEINKFCTYLCFLCVRKRKNLENILLDEGMNIIVEQLDVINLFKKMHKNVNIQDALKKDLIEMSDECKMNMNDII